MVVNIHTRQILVGLICGLCLFIATFWLLGLPSRGIGSYNEYQERRIEMFEKKATRESTLVTTITTSKTPLLASYSLLPLKDEPLSDRWIVVTSIQKPTDDVRLLGTLHDKGWRVLVVGDKSTPPDWEAPPGVRFLGYDEASRLGYNLLQFQRWKTYSIKNIGYLFAIQHGAQIIYDTDDDNHPTDNLAAFISLANVDSEIDDAKTIKALVLDPGHYKGSSLPAINTLPHFGQSSLWPRGFPLREVAKPPTRSYLICETQAPSWIQGVVNGDPDMDAIFRLTRKHFSTPINLTFDSAPPFVVPEGFFVQSNSQNTFFTQKSLPLLFFPHSPRISMRETDIWRAYIGQALLWLVGGRKAYVAPNAFQARNPHDYLKDFEDEINLYKLADRLVQHLSEWSCPSSLDFGQCLINCYQSLADANLIATSEDVAAVEAWVSDLRRMNFIFAKRGKTVDCNDAAIKAQFFPIEQPMALPAKSKLNLAFEFDSNLTQIFENSQLPKVPSKMATLILVLAKFDLNAQNQLENLLMNHFERSFICIEHVDDDHFRNFTLSHKFSYFESSRNLVISHSPLSVMIDCLLTAASIHLDTNHLLAALFPSDRPFDIESFKSFDWSFSHCDDNQNPTLISLPNTLTNFKNICQA